MSTEGVLACVTTSLLSEGAHKNGKSKKIKHHRKASLQ
jgi:hypothetical protein